MSDGAAPAPGQGLAVWIVSGSLALVMLIGGAVAFGSGGKRTEDGNPSANQTVAPGSGHTSGPATTAPVVPPETTNPAPPTVIDPTADPGTSGIPVERTDPGTGTGSGRDPGGEVPAPVPGRDPSQVIAKELATHPEPTGPVEPGEVAGPTTSPDPAAPSPTPELAGSAPGTSSEPGPGGTTRPEPPPSAPEPTDLTPPGPGPSEPAPQFTDIAVSWSATGDELRVGAGVPDGAGSYPFTVAVNGTPVTIGVRVTDDQQVSLTSDTSARNPYTYAVGTRRLNGTFSPADFGYSSATFPSQSTVDVSTDGGATIAQESTLPPAPQQAAVQRPTIAPQQSAMAEPTETEGSATVGPSEAAGSATVEPSETSDSAPRRSAYRAPAGDRTPATQSPAPTVTATADDPPISVGAPSSTVSRRVDR